MIRSSALVSLLLASIACGSISAQESSKTFQTIKLWSDRAPGETKEYPAEGDTSKPGDRGVADRAVVRIGNVTQPDLRIYSPAPYKATGACVLVCPGGGYNILAYDLEGTEVCEWLNSIGVTAALLKYRVPRREGKAPYEAPLQDAQRALNLLRSKSNELKIDPKRIGCLGFSAGGNLCTMLTTRFSTLTYSKSDAADELVPRPDFTLLIYPAYLIDKNNKQQLASDVVFTKETPPMFLTMAQDDGLGCENVLVPALKLNELKVPFSLHLYPTGGHGYGLRNTASLSRTWPDRAAEWMQQQGFLESKK